MKDIIDFINGATRRLAKDELEELVKMGVKPISRDAFATCILQELGDELLGERVFDDSSYDAVIPNNIGTKVMFVTCEGEVPLFDTYCGDVIALALKEKYNVERSFRNIINIATMGDKYGPEDKK